MNNPRISVVTVCYNAVNTIDNTILSVINQTYSNIEYIIIDGASTDGTVDIINKYRDKISIFVSEPDKGIYDAMNKGIRLALGDYIYFLNAGDILFGVDVLRTIANYLDGKSVYYGDAYTRGSLGEIKSFRIGPFSKYRLARTNICHQTIFYPTDCISKEFYNLDYRLLADYVMNMYLWRKAKFFYVNIPIIVYEGGGVSEFEIDETFKKNRRRLILKCLGIDAWMYLVFIKVKKMFQNRHKSEINLVLNK